MELIILLFLLFTSTSSSQAFDYDHMEMVLQWPPTYCGMANVHCNPAVSSKMQFTIHGLWPGDARGNTRQTCPDKPRDPTDAVRLRQMWEQDNQLKKDLNFYWPTLESGGTNEDFWTHEWDAHGFCTKDTVPAREYFRAAMRFAKKQYMKKMLTMLINSGMPPTNDNSYSSTQLKTFISTNVVRNKDYQVFLSCQPANASYVFLHEIHFCLDKALKTFISCPRSSDTRGCGGPNKENKLIIPTRVK